MYEITGEVEYTLWPWCGVSVTEAFCFCFTCPSGPSTHRQQWNRTELGLWHKLVGVAYAKPESLLKLWQFDTVDVRTSYTLRQGIRELYRLSILTLTLWLNNTALGDTGKNRQNWTVEHWECSINLFSWNIGLSEVLVSVTVTNRWINHHHHHNKSVKENAGLFGHRVSTHVWFFVSGSGRGHGKVKYSS